ncbi:hypothetical protein [Streptomyces sp. WAC 04229]|uniref:hypothetical protein n=1 Tax=Streptomyces sp. WAC 04229 TaxID=2203206 RepID=UPI000F737694|nr:hypothetical protein [Streptomyces sp. WAC 04229]
MSDTPPGTRTATLDRGATVGLTGLPGAGPTSVTAGDARGPYTRQAPGRPTDPTGVDDPYPTPGTPAARLDTRAGPLTASAGAVHADPAERGLA